MKTLREVKSIIFKTECKDLIFEGLSRSEPIMTLGEEGIVDNYFIYASNNDHTIISEPMVVFGIYSDLEKVAYINSDVYDSNLANLSNAVDRDDIKENYMVEYEELYKQIRGFVYQTCSEEQRIILRNYVEHLCNLSGSGLWKSYKKIAPQFFEWINKEDIFI